ncbi:MAG: UDP-N-acetylmuramoyl-L-alanyl-D-glutamate--2,6-diaminopimelate ligase [Muribaculaceae bacterium]|nr:UDP-N-acetylmuramoyl-L-alanyl-D-glutamate--2,6-diaminopimelate ligase [Muribaculaceae bacterium]
MNLDHLIKAINPVKVVGPTDREIIDLVSDSRKAVADTMFVAVRGVNVDGHSFIPSLADKRVGAIVVDTLPETLFPETTYVVVENTSIALGFLASQWYDNPSQKLKLVGVTGTNGKTTTATLIYEMARQLGYKAGLLSTVCNYIELRPIPTNQTTPDPLTINRLLHDMVEEGCSYCAMEVSSHAAVQHRIAGLKFAGGIFSNLTRDHLDYHKTFEAYLEAKKSFFDGLPTDAFALTNIDDKVGEVMLQNTKAARKTYSLRSMADFNGRIVESHLDGTLMSFNGHEVYVLFTGRFNAYNLTAVYGASILLGWPMDAVLEKMSVLVPVAGRFQTFHSPTGVTAIVDYAHTPDAIINVLETIREVIGDTGSIITVVGAGGNRDEGKRPIMAREAALRSDRLILTSDNPRFEEPTEILAGMRAGLDTRDLLRKTLLNVDRREAIRTAINLAGPGDVVLVAGKGHEDYQEIRGEKHHFDDREVVREAFAEL